MDPSIISALSAILGSVVGGTASISTAWLTQRTQSRHDSINNEIKRRELVYTEFISECSKLAIDALDKNLDSPSTLIQVYALQNRIRLLSSDAVILAAAETLKAIFSQYFEPHVTLDELRKKLNTEKEDPLKPFSEACRNELQNLHLTKI